MIKDYYQILDIPVSATEEEIKRAYRSQSMKWHPDRNPGQDTTAMMQDINEAYNILKNPTSRSRYDLEYARYDQVRQSRYSESVEYDIHDQELKQDVRQARKEAEDYVKEFMASLKKDTAKAAKGAWEAAKGYVIVGIVMSFFGIAFLTCSCQNSYDKGPKPKELPQMVVDNPSQWHQHTFYDAFSIMVPSSVEQLTNNCEYSRDLASKGYERNDEVITFCQKGLPEKDEKAMGQYCRIMLLYQRGQRDDFFRRNETVEFNFDYYLLFNEIVEQEIGPYSSLMGTIEYEWIRINEANGVLISYKRTGNNFDFSIPVNCKLVILMDDYQSVKMILSYREKEADLWEKAFDNVLRSFKWID